MDKTYVFDNNDGGCGSNGMMGLIASLCNQRGLDPNLVAALMNNNRGNNDGFGNSAWWIIILLIFGWGGFGGFGGGFGGRGNAQGLADLGNLVNNDAGRELLMNAIQGNANAIGQLSTKLGCDYNALNGAIQNLATQLCNLGNQVGLGQRDIIQQLMLGNQSLASQLCECCCSTKQLISDFKGDIALQMCQQTGTLSNGQRDITAAVTQGFCDATYATREQTGQILNAIEAQSRMITDKFCGLELREMQRENQNLRDQVQAFQLSASQQAQTANIVQQLQPVPRPAYWVPNPYCGCNNFGYNGYNNGCCGNNNNCGNGCGCC